MPASTSRDRMRSTDGLGRPVASVSAASDTGASEPATCSSRVSARSAAEDSSFIFQYLKIWRKAARLVRILQKMERCRVGNAGVLLQYRFTPANMQSKPRRSARRDHEQQTTHDPSEAFVETLVAQGVKDVFGIVGSAFMDALDLFPAAGIRFVPTVHEQGAAHMADGYSRVTGRHGVCIAQNGPGITNFVTGVAAAYWAHSPVVAITPETGTSGMGLGGFQETEQLPIFSRITKYQAHVNRPDRMAEFTAKAFDNALAERGPTQLNIPRDYFYGEIDVAIPEPRRIRRGPGSKKT